MFLCSNVYFYRKNKEVGKLVLSLLPGEQTHLVLQPKIYSL